MNVYEQNNINYSKSKHLLLSVLFNNISDTENEMKKEPYTTFSYT